MSCAIDLQQPQAYISSINFISPAALSLHLFFRHLQQFSTMVVQNAPTSQTTPASLPPSVFTLPQTAQLEALYTIIRDKDTSRGDFLFYSDRIIRLLVEEGLNHLPVVPKTVETPTVSLTSLHATQTMVELGLHYAGSSLRRCRL